MSSPPAMRACTDQERAFLELSLILDTVNYEEFRTKPWTASQRKEVGTLRQKREALGGDAGTVSAGCRAAAS